MGFYFGHRSFEFPDLYCDWKKSGGYVKYILADATELAIKHPDTFEAPSFEEINQIEIGDFVKLCFVLGENRQPSAERIWIKVTEITKEILTKENRVVTRLVGTLANQPVFFEMNYGDPVTCEPNHIYSIMKEQ